MGVSASTSTTTSGGTAKSGCYLGREVVRKVLLIESFTVGGRSHASLLSIAGTKQAKNRRFWPKIDVFP